jgi:hypothetical protein
MVLHGDGLVRILTQHVRTFVEGDIFAEVPEHDPLIVLNESENGGVCGGDVGIGVLANLEFGDGNLDREFGGIAIRKRTEMEE